MIILMIAIGILLVAVGIIIDIKADSLEMGVMISVALMLFFGFFLVFLWESQSAAEQHLKKKYP